MRDRGFTLAEGMIVVVILSILVICVIFAVAGIANFGDDGRQSCLDRGGQVQENAIGEYSGCILPREQG